MGYKEGVEKLFPLVGKLSSGVDSGFFPETESGEKLFKAVILATGGIFKEAFWYLFELIIEDLIPIAPIAGQLETPRLREELIKILGNIEDDDQRMILAKEALLTP